MNSINIMGRIATDLKLKPVRSAAGVVLNFRIAVDRYTVNGKVTDFIRHAAVKAVGNAHSRRNGGEPVPCFKCLEPVGLLLVGAAESKVHMCRLVGYLPVP